MKSEGENSLSLFVFWMQKRIGEGELSLAELSNRVLQLRSLLSGARDQTFEFFDEFLCEHEFDLALHVVCDFLIASPTVCLSDAVFNEIRDLHKQMGLEDHCISDLEKKIKNIGGIQTNS